MRGGMEFDWLFLLYLRAFGRALFASQSPYMPAKMSQTAETLCVMPKKLLKI
jgi:hypothetical protein